MPWPYGAATALMLHLPPLLPTQPLTTPAPEPAPAAAPAPADAAPAPPADTTSVRRVPIEGWTDVHAGCRLLTTLASSSEGCDLGMRIGDVAYFHTGGGFFQTPQYERYMRYVGDGSSTRSPAPSPSVTVIDPTRSNVYYVELGPGVAMWPTRQLQVHGEIGGMAGVIHNPASLALPTRSSDSFVLGAFAGLGVSYRIKSMPWALGFDYRVQGVPYGGLGSAEEVTQSGYEVGQSLFGWAHSFGLSAIYRIEHDGSN